MLTYNIISGTPVGSALVALFFNIPFNGLLPFDGSVLEFVVALKIWNNEIIVSCKQNMNTIMKIN